MCNNKIYNRVEKLVANNTSTVIAYFLLFSSLIGISETPRICTAKLVLSNRILYTNQELFRAFLWSSLGGRTS